MELGSRLACSIATLIAAVPAAAFTILNPIPGDFILILIGSFVVLWGCMKVMEEEASAEDVLKVGEEELRLKRPRMYKAWMKYTPEVRLEVVKGMWESRRLTGKCPS